MYIKIFKYFLVWRTALFFIAFLAGYFVPTFGGRFPYWDTILQLTKAPNWIWGFGNFDGVHYIKIAYEGYQAAFSQAFFPLYPFLVKVFNFLPRNINLDPRYFVDPSFFYTALLLSNLFCFLFLVYFYKLLRIDYSKKTSFLTLILLLSFPTAFFLGSIYTESLFLFLTIASVYYYKKEKYILAGVLAALSSATRITGIFLLIVFVIDFFKNRKLIDFKKLVTILITPFGLIFYMLYLNKNFGDSLMFFHVQPGFGAFRSGSEIVLLPQVVYRYIKIITTVDIFSLQFLNSFVELFFTLGVLSLIIIFYKKMKPEYFWYSLVILILPTLTGTFSSMPRYILAIFPIFSVLAKFAKNKVKYVVFMFFALQIIFVCLFIRGYWIA